MIVLATSSNQRGFTLGYRTNDVDHAARDDCPLAAIDICNITGCESTKESTGRENGHDKRSVVTADSANATGSSKALRADRALDLFDEKRGVEDAVDVPRIIACLDMSMRNE